MYGYKKLVFYGYKNNHLTQLASVAINVKITVAVQIH